MVSDFVTNSHGESWDSSCEKSRVPAKKKKSLKLQMLGTTLNVTSMWFYLMLVTAVKLVFNKMNTLFFRFVKFLSKAKASEKAVHIFGKNKKRLNIQTTITFQEASLNHTQYIPGQ